MKIHAHSSILQIVQPAIVQFVVFRISKKLHVWALFHKRNFFYLKVYLLISLYIIKF